MVNNTLCLKSLLWHQWLLHYRYPLSNIQSDYNIIAIHMQTLDITTLINIDRYSIMHSE